MKKSLFAIFSLCVLIYTLSWVFVYFTGINKSTIPSEDTLPATFLPVSIIRDRDFYLDEFVPYFIKNYHDPDDKTKPSFYLDPADGHYVSAFPIVAPVLSVPVYLIPTVLMDFNETSLWIPFLAKLSAAIFASISVVFVFLTLKEFLIFRQALFLSLLYAFGSNTYALSSQGLWQHGSSQMFLSAALYFLIVGIKDTAKIPLAGIFLSLATMARPTGFIVAVILTIYVFLKYRQLLAKYFVFALLPLIPWVLYNKVYLGSFFKQAYDEGELLYNWYGRFPEGFFGLWLSPSKGLLVYSPIFFFSVIGAVIIFRRKDVLGEYNTIFRVFAILILIFTLVMGKWFHWYGGWSFGYRMAVDITPFLMLLIVPVVKTGLFNRLKILFVIFGVWSLFVQLLGMAYFDGEWHARFDEGPETTAWLWSISNSEIAYYLKKSYCRVISSGDVEYLKCQGFEGL